MLSTCMMCTFISIYPSGGGLDDRLSSIPPPPCPPPRRPSIYFPPKCRQRSCRTTIYYRRDAYRHGHVKNINLYPHCFKTLRHLFHDIAWNAIQVISSAIYRANPWNDRRDAFFLLHNARQAFVGKSGAIMHGNKIFQTRWREHLAFTGNR